MIDREVWIVYILRSLRDGKRYIGCTNNLDKRLRQHNSGRVAATKRRTPLEVIHTEEYLDRAEAFLRERRIKDYKGGNALKDLLARAAVRA